MKTLPGIDSYSKAQKDQAGAFSPCLEQTILRASLPGHYGLRNRVWSEALLAEFTKSVSTEDICRAWSLVSDKILSETAENIFQEESVALFTFGKLGSHELNLSSDVDVLFIAEEVTDKIVQKVRLFQRKLSEVTENGFLFRVDFELRPGGNTAPLVPSLDQVMDYYGNYGETWERMAFIRLRPVWGVNSLQEEVMKFRKKFSFRKHLDFGLLEDLNSLRNKVHAHAKTKLRENSIDLKLGLGGIRDIELFCHALQVIHGGRNAELHTPSTTKAFELFATHQILPVADTQFLAGTYWFLRHYENLVQGISDSQTHYLNYSVFSTHEVSDIKKQMQRAADLVSGLLGSIKTQSERLPEDPEAQKAWLVQNGFLPDEIAANWNPISEVPLLSRQKEKDSEQRQQFLALILKKMGRGYPSKNRLIYLHEFLQSIRAKSSFFSLLIKNEPLIEMLAEVFCTSPFLSRSLCSRPEILDSLVMRNVESTQIDSEWDDFLQGLVDMKQLTEFIAGADFLRTLNLDKLLQSQSQLADDIVLRLWSKVSHDNKSDQIIIWALGKWGGNELGLFSDLDCIFVKNGVPQENDFKALRRFINRLTEAHRGGALYSIDTRLRTSEQTGILLTSRDELQEYLTTKMKPWEKQAYLLAREIGKSESSLTGMKEQISSRILNENELQELNRIRIALIANSRGSLDLKYAEGGLVDTELSVQTALLQTGSKPLKYSLNGMIESLQINSPQWEKQKKSIQERYNFMRVVEQCHRLVSDESHPILDPQNENFRLVAFHLKLTPDELENRLRLALKDQSQEFKLLDPRRAQK